MENSNGSPVSTPSRPVAAERHLELIKLHEKPLSEPRRITGSELFGYAYHRFLVVADAIALMVSCGVALLVASLTGAGANSGQWALTVLALAPVWVLIAYQFGLYGLVEQRLNFDFVDELVPAVTALTVWCWCLVLVGGITASDGPNLFGSAVLWFASIPLLLLFRAVARIFAKKRPWFLRSVALIGSPVAVELLGTRIDRHPEWGLTVELKLTRDDDDRRWEISDGESADNESKTLSETDFSAVDLAKLVRKRGIDRAMVAGGSANLGARTELVHTLLDREVAVDYLAGGPETLYATSITQHLEGMTFMSSRPSHPGPLVGAIKRMIDVILAATLLVATAPVMAVAAIRIKRGSPGPVFYRQVRSGLHEETFEVIKLRTMYDGAHDGREALRRATQSNGNDDVLFKLDDDPRVTKAGQWLRRTSLDELPQLWNVLKGDMSMVGPRPLVPEEAGKAHGMYLARFNVRPGIAGPWQAQGRSEIPFEDMLRLDYSYVAGWSLAEDLNLLLRTVSAVLGRKGAK